MPIHSWSHFNRLLSITVLKLCVTSACPAGRKSASVSTLLRSVWPRGPFCPCTHHRGHLFLSILRCGISFETLQLEDLTGFPGNSLSAPVKIACICFVFSCPSIISCPRPFKLAFSDCGGQICSVKNKSNKTNSALEAAWISCKRIKKDPLSLLRQTQFSTVTLIKAG